MPVTVGQIIVNGALPPRFRDYGRSLGADELEGLLSRIIREDPDSYRDVSAKLMRIGNKAAYEEGTTLKLSDVAPPVDREGLYRRLDFEEAAIQANPNLTDEEKRDALSDLYDKAYAATKKQTYEAASAAGNGFAMQVKSKARGNQDQLSAMINTPGVYKDPSGKTVPLFIRHSYADGLTPAEYWAGSYGARTGVVSTKFATAKAGELGKLLSLAAIEQVVTEDDCGTPNGMPVKVDDKDNVGAVLARDAGKYNAGTVLTKEVLADIEASGEDEIVVRSPTTCNTRNGVCAHCAGIRENGKFPELGYSLGLNSASALAERIAQGSLNCLAEGTLVRMADGSVKPIEKVEPGEMVFGSDKTGHAYPTRVVDRYDNGWQPCVRTYVSRYSGIDVYSIDEVLRPSGGVCTVELVSTPVHKVLSDLPGDTSVAEIGRLARDSWKSKASENYAKAPLVTVAEYYDTPRHNDTFDFDYQWEIRAADIIGQESVGLQHVYDLEVEHPDHLFILANGLIVSNTKHSGRKLEGSGYSGFDMLKRMATVPKVYADRASVAEVDGTVTKVVPASQGGSYVYVGEESHYVPSGYKVLVKPGDEVEAGDQLSDGVINPADAVRLKGIGEGRRYFTERFTQAFRESGYKVNRRNVEAVAKALINNVVVDDEDAEGDRLPGDHVAYSSWAWAYKPRQGSENMTPRQAVGRYLEQPAMHYSIGTRITPKVAERLEKFKVKSVLSNKNPVGVHPEMESVVQTTGNTDDWMARLGTTYLGRRLVEDAQLGSESNTKGVNPYPAVAKGTGLGEWGTPGHRDEGFHY